MAVTERNPQHFGPSRSQAQTGGHTLTLPYLPNAPVEVGPSNLHSHAPLSGSIAEHCASEQVAVPQSIFRLKFLANLTSAAPMQFQPGAGIMFRPCILSLPYPPSLHGWRKHTRAQRVWRKYPKSERRKKIHMNRLMVT